MRSNTGGASHPIATGYDQYADKYKYAVAARTICACARGWLTNASGADSRIKDAKMQMRTFPRPISWKATSCLFETSVERFLDEHAPPAKLVSLARQGLCRAKHGVAGAGLLPLDLGGAGGGGATFATRSR